MAKAALAVMAATALSRILGYAREVLQAAYFGAGAQMDAYRIAYQLPNLFRMLLADAAIAAAFIPVFSSYLARKEEDEAWKFASSIINLVVIVLFFVTVLGMVFAPYLIGVLAPGFKLNKSTFELSVSLTRVMFPVLTLMAITGIVAGVLNSYNRFMVAALSPVLWNIVIISSIVALGSSGGIYALAGGVVAATLFQFIIQLPDLGKRLRKYKLAIDLSQPGTREFFALLVPVVLSAATTNINTVVDSRFASILAVGSVASLGYAIRVFMMPSGIFGVAISTVLFPALSRQATLEKIIKFKEYLSFGIRSIIAIVTPLSFFFIAFSLPIVKLLFERGEFLAGDSLMTASPLLYYSISLVPMSIVLLMNRAYYALKDSKTPFYIALASIAVNYFGNWLFIKVLPAAYQMSGFSKEFAWLGFPHGGIALSTSLVTIFQMSLLMWLYSKKYGSIDGGKILLTVIKCFAASAAGLIGACLAYMATSGIFSGAIGLLFSLSVSFAALVALYFIMVVILRVEEVMKFLILTREKLSSRVS